MKKEHYSYIMMLGHLCVDLSTFSLIALSPFLVTSKNMSYTSVAGLIFIMSLINALSQPLFGALADKKSRPWMMGLGVLMSGWGIALLGFFESYTAMLFCIAVSSIGLALYHPDGGRMANFVSGKAKGKGVSNFSFGGNLSGFVGPVLTVFAVSHFGMHGTIIIAIPATLMALWLFSLNSRFLKFAEDGQKEMATAMKAGQKDDWHGFMRLFFVTIMRSAIMNGMNTFIPLFWLSILMQTEETSGLITSLIALAGAFATLTGGRMSDKLGYKNMIRTGLIALVPCMAIAAYTRSIFVSAVILFLAAFCLNLAYSPSVVLGQKLIPNHMGLASGITMGLAQSFGGIVSPLLGKVGDVHGVGLVMWILVAICVLAALSSIILPNDPDQIIIKSKKKLHN